jgi:hypothetical protein
MSIGTYDLTREFYDEMLRNPNPIDHDYEVEFNEFQNSKEFSTFGWRRWKANIQRIGIKS